eukprot:COSAG06_NODE_2652_length_6494_cov_3.278499_6_plen_114_part_00
MNHFGLEGEVRRNLFLSLNLPRHALTSCIHPSMTRCGSSVILCRFRFRFHFVKTGSGCSFCLNCFFLDCCSQVDIEIGSLSKAFSVMGGFIAAKQPLVDAYLMSARQRCAHTL